jgi:outer membrane protein assembly factor BamB
MRHGQVRRESLLYVVVAATRPRYCGILLVAALWLTAGLVCPGGRLAAQKRKHTPPPPPFASLFPLEETWTITLPALPAAPAAHDGSRIYVPLVSEMLVALDWRNGDTVWSVPLKATSAPVPANGVVYVAAGDAVHALDAATGAARWTAPIAGRAGLIRLAGARVLAIGTGAITAFDAASGAPQWTQSLDDAGDPLGAVVSGEAVFVSFAKGAVRRIGAGDGRVAWSRMFDGRPSPPLQVEDSVYVGATDNRFYALASKDGKVRWSWRTGGDVIGAVADVSVNSRAANARAANSDTANSKAATPKAVYYASLDAVVRAVNPGNGHQRWKRDGGTRAVAPPLALDGSILVAGLTPALSGFAPLTGAPQGTFDLPGEGGEVHGTPLVTETLAPRAVAVVIVLKDGRAFGLRALSLMFNESAPQLLLALPGAPLPRERLP